MLPNLDSDLLIGSVSEIIKKAGAAVMAVYNSDEFGTIYKSDKSPLTLADKASNKIIIDGLKKLTPEVPILSEESPEIIPDNHHDMAMVWLVDPLDGTKEFIDKTGDFTVNIGLIKDGLPILGAVYAPAKQWLYTGIFGRGAWREHDDGSQETISVGKNRNPPVVAVSRSHQNAATKAYLKKLGPHELLELGSSLKLCYVADGTADLYPRLSPCMEWDTAAGDAVIRAAGGQVINYETGQLLEYNKQDLHNPFFIAGSDLGDKKA